MPQLTIASPVGPLTLVEERGRLTQLHFGGGYGKDETPILVKARRQLAEYFAGKRREFDLPLHLEGSPFQRSVWAAMQRIPYGETRSYGEIAHETNSAPRAVGGACGKNPIAIIVPCHRILASGRRIGGYSGGEGLPTKQHLLRLEGARLVESAAPHKASAPQHPLTT